MRDMSRRNLKLWKRKSVQVLFQPFKFCAQLCLQNSTLWVHAGSRTRRRRIQNLCFLLSTILLEMALRELALSRLYLTKNIRNDPSVWGILLAEQDDNRKPSWTRRVILRHASLAPGVTYNFLFPRGWKIKISQKSSANFYYFAFSYLGHIQKCEIIIRMGHCYRFKVFFCRAPLVT